VYLLYRVYWHWATFSSYHMFGYVMLVLSSFTMKNMLIEAAASGTGSE
jgi:hypothetical protein